MTPKKSSESNKSKIELKEELIAKHESGMCVSDLAAVFEMPKSTVCTILKNKEVIKASDVAKGVTTLTSKRSKFIEEVEKLLLVWINEKQLVGDPISEDIIWEKARLLYTDLKKDVSKRTGIHSVVMLGEAASSKVDAAAKFVKKFSEFVNTEGIIDKAWRELSLRTMNSAWKKLWPECVAGLDFEGFEEQPVVPVIVSLGKSMGLEVSEEDVERLVEDP
ncbi:hypothetical protein chiPu_0009920 [Chiloscyllium punctatum]|uniref:Uncharacterized protein n=1 Tax=Chiloscyllium punctatum TaxID=137246 RepID=A0A401SM47_CHIPU|nr:hypothetical protein [Chiloscyllium punctatum]